jgi:hypothetical protein
VCVSVDFFSLFDLSNYPWDLRNNLFIMNTRRYRISRREENEVVERTRVDDARREAILSIEGKLRDNNVKIETIIEECTQYDINNDGLIHPDDLVDAIKDILPRNALSRREFHHLISTLGGVKGQNVPFNQLKHVFEDIHRKEEPREDWVDDEVDAGEFAPYEKDHGSIGEWLSRKACPAEVQSFKQFIACLELFEHESGMRIDSTDEGFEVSLGPDLRATVKFHVK